MSNWWDPVMREAFAGQRVVIAGAVAAAWVDHVTRLHDYGVDDILIITTEGAGAGEGPDAPVVAIEPSPDMSMMERLHHTNVVLRDLPDHALEALAMFDPDRTAVVVGAFTSEVSDVDGRPAIAYRRPEWVALEDKVVVDSVWDEVGLRRQPSSVVRLEDAGAAAGGLDRGAGTVWAADARDGFHGGGTGTFWVVDDESRDVAIHSLSTMCDTVRVMPFVEGVACSIHGIVLPDGVVALRPVEMVSLRRGSDLVYAGCATYWDPPAAVRDQMRDAARRTGEYLRTSVGFRGTFTIDGVVAHDGFWPTELNPRFGAGIMTIARACGGVPMFLLNDLIVGGYDIGRSAADLEAEWVALADQHRGGGTWIPGATPTVSVAGRNVTELDGLWAWAADDDDVAGTVIAGGSFVRCTYSPGTVSVGPSTAPRAASFWAFADRELGTSVGPLTAPPSTPQSPLP